MDLLFVINLLFILDSMNHLLSFFEWKVDHLIILVVRFYESLLLYITSLDDRTYYPHFIRLSQCDHYRRHNALPDSTKCSCNRP